MPNMNWLRLPAEMRVRRQWAVSSLAPIPGTARVDKAPRNPVTKQLCSPVDPSTWGTFEEAVNSGMPGIGFMLTAEDPFVVIDLDNKGDLTEKDISRHNKIYNSFDSYAERSQSGNGVHIILVGQIGGGMNRDKVEIYDQERYIICTGDTLRDRGLASYPELLATMVAEMGGINGRSSLGESGLERYTDDELLEKAYKAKNGEKFKRLFTTPPKPGDDWSQLDASLAQMIAFYTRNHEQALRIFRRSALYRPHGKGKNPTHYEEYYLLDRTFRRAWEAEAQRDADVEHGRQLAEGLIARQKMNGHAHHVPTSKVPDFPPGLVGEVADFILKASPRPVKEIALAGALAFCAGIVGRQFNVGGTGLNQYIVLLAETGRGKESAPSGVEALVSAIKTQINSIEDFMGPAYFASGQALVRALDKSPVLYSAIGEFGHLLSRITNSRASPSDVALRQMLLALFSKSGRDQMLRSTAYSDAEKNTKILTAPCFTLLGDTTPEAYYNIVSADTINEGLLPRFLTITYDGPRTPLNEDVQKIPNKELVDHLAGVVQSVLQMQSNLTFVEVPFDAEAQALDASFNLFCDDKINAGGSAVEVWNRAHLKARRVAAVVAVGRNHLAPCITAADFNWAAQLIMADLETITHRVDTGDTGGGESRRLPLVEKAIRDFMAMDPDKKMISYRVPKAIVDDKIMPYGYFRRRFKMHKSFTDDPRGLVMAIKTSLQDAVELGLLSRMSDEQRMARTGYKTDGDWFVLGHDWKD